jgi:hypothetical protein
MQQRILLAAAPLVLAVPLFSQSTPTPVAVPATLIGLPSFPAFPYAPGASLGPLGPIDNPAVDADLIGFAQVAWQYIDSGGTNTASLLNWQWTAPDLLDLTGPANDAETQPAIFGGGMELFRALYIHRLAPQTPGGPATIYDLLETNTQVALLFKHWTLTHQLATVEAWDPIAHQKHITMVIDAVITKQYASTRGVPLFQPGLLISDRTEIEVWAGVPWNYLGAPPPAGVPDPITRETQKSVEDCVANESGKLTGPWPSGKKLYKSDKLATWFGLVSGTPGFDCDDFADAIGAYLTKGKAGASYCTVYTSWIATDPSNGKKKGKVGHLVTMIKAGGKYWLVDAQTGATSGPFDAGTPPDASTVTGGYSKKPGSDYTDPKPIPPNDRSRWSGEPPPWHTSREMKECFNEVTGLDRNCFIYTAAVAG